MIYPMFASGGLLYAFEHSTLEGKLVILALGMGSIFSWSIMIAKFIQIRRASSQMAAFLKKFRQSSKPLTLFLKNERFIGAPAYEVYRAGSQELARHLTGSSEVDETFSIRLQDSTKIPVTAMNSVRSTIERQVGEQGLLLEDQMVLLATAVSGAPFLGLLGTVWGVMDTFSGIAIAGKASLAAMAPGVSGALITTVTGLLVAIPAMFGYNYLVNSVRHLTIEVDNFASELMAAFEHFYSSHK